MGTGIRDGLRIRPLEIAELKNVKQYYSEIRAENGKRGRNKRRNGRKKGNRAFKPREYQPKKFIAWDGEGISDTPNEWQRYVCFGNSEGMAVFGHDLSTEQCLDLCLESAETFPGAINIVFGMDYDINMICRGMHKQAVKVLHKQGEIYNWKGYHIEYIPKKIFRVWKHKRYGGKGKRCSFTLYDVFTFFSVSFVKALRQYNAIPESVIAEIESGKNQRGVFRDEEIETLILPYWRKELQALVSLVRKLEESLSGAYIDLDSYHGPGAVADYLLKKFNVQAAMPDYRVPEGLQYAIQCAYAGGRFEQFKLGKTNERIYQYDIRSAYPYAITKLPNLHGSNWLYTKTPKGPIQDFSLYKIRDFWSGDLSRPQPFFFRHKTGNIIYPFQIGSGWYYGIEIKAAREAGFKVNIEEAWILNVKNNDSPFRWVATIYAQRRNWQRIGNPAEKAAKLGINSLYGKFAQRVGGTNDSPKWHVLEWAGMVTAHCRAQLFHAIYQCPECVIACETDSIFSLVPLDIPISENLGDWEAKELEGITYLQSGIYFTGDRQGDSKIDKYRGLAPGTLDLARVTEFLECPDKEGIPVSVHRFRTMGSAIAHSYENWPGDWCRWQDLPKVVNPLSLQGKRIHTNCDVCKRSGRDMTKGLHDLYVNVFVNTSGESAKHKLEWIDGEESIVKEMEDFSD